MRDRLSFVRFLGLALEDKVPRRAPRKMPVSQHVAVDQLIALADGQHAAQVFILGTGALALQVVRFLVAVDDGFGDEFVGHGQGGALGVIDTVEQSLPRPPSRG